MKARTTRAFFDKIKEKKRFSEENMTKTLYLVRHGQTYFNYYHKVQGRCDSPLNERGIRQVEMARDYFKKQVFILTKLFHQPKSVLAILWKLLLIIKCLIRV